MSDARKKHAKQAAHAPAAPQPAPAGTKAGVVPWPPLIYLAAIAVSVMRPSLP